MQKAILAIAVLSCIAQPAASATRSDTTAAEAIILYNEGDRDFIAYFLGLARGWLGLIAICNSKRPR